MKKKSQDLQKHDVESNKSTEKKEKGRKGSHTCKCDQAPAFYDQPKRPAQRARKQEIHIFVGHLATSRTAQIADIRRKKKTERDKERKG